MPLLYSTYMPALFPPGYTPASVQARVINTRDSFSSSLRYLRHYEVPPHFTIAFSSQYRSSSLKMCVITDLLPASDGSSFPRNLRPVIVQGNVFRQRVLILPDRNSAIISKFFHRRKFSEELLLVARNFLAFQFLILSKFNLKLKFSKVKNSFRHNAM